MTFNMNEKIKNLSKFDYCLNMRMQKMTALDLIAAGAVYHSTCHIELERKAQQSSHIKTNDSSSSFIALCQELIIAADKGQVRSKL